MPNLEDDYMQRARDHWQRYQFYVYVGLAMLLAAITGFTFSHSFSEDARREANTALYKLISSADEGDSEAAETAYVQLQQSDEFQELDYLAAFVLSSLHFSHGAYADAVSVLAPALAGSDDSGIRQLAALRMAEAHLAAHDAEAARALLNDNMPASGHLRILFSERLGDAAVIAGELGEAKSAYDTALQEAEEGNLSFYRPLLRIKIGALLSTPEAARTVMKEAEERRELLQALMEKAEADVAEQEEAAAAAATETEADNEAAALNAESAESTEAVEAEAIDSAESAESTESTEESDESR